MRVTRLQLACFRNYKTLDLQLPQGLTLLLGGNAQGKTNVLEALLLLCIGRSHRTPRDRELIRFGDDEAAARATLERRTGKHTLEMRIPQLGRRAIKLDGNALKRTGEMLGNLNAVLFAPEDLSLVKDGPQERRRFVDMALSQLRPSYFYALQRYHRALKQRQSLLKRMAHGAADATDAELAAWDEQLALEGAMVMNQRSVIIRRLAEEARGYHSALSDGKEVLEVSYSPAGKYEPTPTSIYAALEKARHEDKRRCVTSVGPHRDDVGLLIQNREARLYASQGQQRTIALALRLAQMQVIRADTGESPVLMLDDVFSELDQRRQQMLLEIAADQSAQTLITATEAPPHIKATVYNIREGQVV